MAPTLKRKASPTATEPVRKKVESDSFANLAVAVSDGVHAIRSAIHAVQNPPARPAQLPATGSKALPPQPVIPPFDIQDIPGAMRKLRMPMGALLMERWFKGELNYSPTDQDEVVGINQNGVPYPSTMIDTTSITMKWVLEFRRAKNGFDTLAESRMLETKRAREILTLALAPYKKTHESIHPWEESMGDIHEFHKKFQFQYIDVNASWSERIAVQLIEEIGNGGIPDDLTGALGSFNFYAAIGKAHFNRQTGTVTVTQVGIYVKDHYTFVTKPGKASQYLGHWNKTHIAILHRHAAAMALDLQLSDTPVEIDKNIFYPVHNRDFTAWQQKYGRGGDFILYSDVVWVTLYRPIVIAL